MERWGILVLGAAGLSAAGWTAPRWLPPVLEFLGTQGDLVQSASAAVQMIGLAGGVLTALWALLKRTPVVPSVPAKASSSSVLQSEDGSVTIGGSLVNSSVIIQAADRHHSARELSGSEEELRAATRTYLDYLHDRYRYLDLKGMGVADRVALKLPLLELFVPLKARAELPKGETWDRSVRLAGRELPEEEAERLGLGRTKPGLVNDLIRAHDGLIVLGDPGSGKTTLLKSLAVAIAENRSDDLGLGRRLPILVPLSAYANALQGTDVRLDAFIGDYVRSLGCDAAVPGMLKTDLEAGRALLLLDGLDEVRDLGLRQTVVRRVVDFFTFHRRAGNKFVMTSRIVGYREVQTVAEGLAECTLVDFDDEDIGLFVEKWTRALERQAQGETRVAETDAEQEWRDLLTAIQGHEGVRRLAANPLLLTILALMKRQDVSLPERRVELYDIYVKTLLSSWNRVRGLDRPPQRDLDVVETVRILAPLALWMHETDPGLGLVKREALQRRLQGIYEERGEDNAEGRARTFLVDVREHAGLLLERGPGEFGFIHLTFEEYLAAVAIGLAAQGDPEKIFGEIVKHLEEPAWREVSLLLIGYVGLIQQLDQVASSAVNDLVRERPGPPGEAVVLAGDALLDVGTGGIVPRSRKGVIEALVETMQDVSVPKRLRRQAGLDLGRLGWLPEDLDVFVEVPPGSFLFGDEKESRTIEYRYWIGKYPVTNHQYARFVEDSGYAREELWSEEGWKWKTEERREGPWSHVDYDNPIFPRIGASWFEAEAYCRWLSSASGSFEIEGTGKPGTASGLQARLPNSMEWERAARGDDGLVYPWGDVFRNELANTEETGPIGTTAVCTYHQSISPSKVWDMSGNVFEWISDKDLRGGCWFVDFKLARCAARVRGGPGYFGGNLGFRVVLSLADSEF